jgi:pyruvate dehydrogenase E2 component (dihydrolipoamide acetyltransferase)
VAKEVIKVPDLGGIEAVTVIELCSQVGDSIDVEESIVVLESDKATMDVPSPVQGTIVSYLVADGDTVNVGDPLAEVEVSADAATESESEVELQPVSEPESTPTETEPPQASPESAKESARDPATESKAEQTILVPDIGSEDKVDVIEIAVAVGDQVEEGDTLLTLESDKAAMEIPSSHSGKILEILVSEGDKLGTGDKVAVIEAAAELAEVPEQAPAAPAAAETQKTTQAEAKKPAQESSQPAPAKPSSASVATPATSSDTIYAGPAVRLLARELGVDLTNVNGTGPKGRIQKDDVNEYVKAALQNPAGSASGAGIPAVPAVDFSQFGSTETVKFSKIQKLTADNMQRNWLNVPHVTHFDDADITDLESFRKQLKAEGEQRGIKVTPVAFLIKAIASSLQAHPEFNRSLSADGESYIQKHYVNVGMAVDTPRGLLVPVIKDADKKGIWEISADVMNFAASARDGKLKPADMQGGCFTISSLGAIGGNGFTPIVNSPEAGILGVSKSQMKPVWNGTEFVPRLMLPLALSYDHRLINGGDAGRFMTHLVKVLSNIAYLSL